MAVAKPPMIHVGTHGNNISRTSGVHKQAVVLHIMSGTLEGCDSWFSNPAAQASANYGIGKDGEIHEYVAPDSGYYPWANGILNQPAATVQALVAANPGRNPNDWCVAPETAILRPDLTWVSAGDLRTGDPIMGFDEAQNEGRRRLRQAAVISTGRARAPVAEILLSDGTRLRSTLNHRWIVRGAKQGSAILSWMRTDEMVRSIRPSNWRRTQPLQLARFFDRVEPQRTYASGYLAAAFDGEGCLHRHTGDYVLFLSFAQRDNAMLAEVRRLLEDLGYGGHHSTRYRVNGSGVYTSLENVRILGGRREVVRFLGEVRPLRLLDRWQQFIDAGDLRLYRTNSVPVESVTVLGEREIVTLGSSTGTYIAEGFGAHNTISIEHEGYTGEPFTPAMEAASAQLTAWLKETYSIPFTESYLLGHYEFDNVNRPQCPGLDRVGWLSFEQHIVDLTGTPGYDLVPVGSAPPVEPPAPDTPPPPFTATDLAYVESWLLQQPPMIQEAVNYLNQFL